MGTSWPDGGRRFKTIGLIHWNPMASAPHPDDKCGHNFLFFTRVVVILGGYKIIGSWYQQCAKYGADHAQGDPPNDPTNRHFTAASRADDKE